MAKSKQLTVQKLHDLVMQANRGNGIWYEGPNGKMIECHRVEIVGNAIVLRGPEE